MPDAKITLQAGVNSLLTPTANTTSWAACNLIRWQGGQVQPLGGWQLFSPTPMAGTCRKIQIWSDLASNEYLAAGTNERLYIYGAAGQTDITPIIATNTLTNAFSTVISTPTVTVHDVANGATAGDWVNLIIPYAVGGLVLLGYYKVATVVDADNYTLTAPTNAASTITLGGTTPAFTTVMSSASVSVALVNHGITVAGGIFTVQVSTAVGGLTLLGEYAVTSITDSDHFIIDAGTTAGSAATVSENSGHENVQYLLPSGPLHDVALTGWGAGGWGTGGYGSSMATSAINPARIWSLDNFGELLLASPVNGGLYVWTPPIASGNVAVPVGGSAPTAMTGMFVAMPQAQVITYGAEASGTQDPLLIRWSDAGSYNNFTPTITNQAGSFRLSRGSRIVSGMQVGQTALIWTDEDVWSMVYQGSPYVYSINILARECGILAPDGAAVLNSNVYWISNNNFFTMQNGTVTDLPCSVWDQIFPNLDLVNADLCVAGSNSAFSEVFFFYPSTSGGGEIDSYVKVTVPTSLTYSQLSTAQYVWDYGTLVRTAWHDSSLLGSSIAADGSGYLQQHEIGYTNNGVAIPGMFAESGFADIAQGQDYPFVDQIIPDFKDYTSSATAQFSVVGTNYPFEATTTYGPYTVTPTATKFISMRARKRQIAFRIDFDGQSFVRIGAVRYRIAPSGRH